MKILHVLGTPRAEGTPNLVLDWLSLPAGGYTQEVFVLHGQPADLSAELRARAAWYGEGDLLRGRGLRKFARITASVRDVCRQRRPDLIICWFTGFACWIAFGVRLALGWRPKLIIHCGCPPDCGTRANWVSRAVLLPAGLLGARCACCSNYVRDSYRSIAGLPARKFETVYNCVRTETIATRATAARRQRAETGRWGIMVAIFEAAKGHAVLLRAVPAVLAQAPDFRLRLVGGGSRLEEMKALAHQLGVEEAVEFLGSRRDVPECLGRSDLFIFPATIHEGLGSVTIEALAAGLPVVACDVPSCQEVLAGGRYGQLVAPDSASALAEGILNSLARPVSTPEDRLSRASYFNPSRMLNEYLQLVGLPTASFP
ncbi:MAG: glycosyltransferase [Rhodospirillales bacterium]|nr:glycosyltransferase [Acetobacter sp.]